MSRVITRRRMVCALGAMAALLRAPVNAMPATIVPRCRVILDNDFAGDPDGLFQLAHHLLSPSVDVRLIVGSHMHAGEGLDNGDLQAMHSAQKASELVAQLALPRAPRVVAGAERALGLAANLDRTPAAEAIIAEALREDSPLPLFYCGGAGLTDLATSLQLEPRIASRLTLAWIGGNEYPGLALAPPGPQTAEYNLTIDVKAVQALFNRSDLPIWQIPRNVYRQMMVTQAELDERVRNTGPLGAFLMAQLDALLGKISAIPALAGLRVGETYTLGDSPLVTLTALQSFFQPDAASSAYVMRPRPLIGDDGSYGKPSGRKPIRVYTQVDTRLTFEDLFAKLAAFGRDGNRSGRTGT